MNLEPSSNYIIIMIFFINSREEDDDKTNYQPVTSYSDSVSVLFEIIRNVHCH